MNRIERRRQTCVSRKWVLTLFQIVLSSCLKLVFGKVIIDKTFSFFHQKLNSLQNRVSYLSLPSCLSTNKELYLERLIPMYQTHFLSFNPPLSRMCMHFHSLPLCFCLYSLQFSREQTQIELNSLKSSTFSLIFSLSF